MGSQRAQRNKYRTRGEPQEFTKLTTKQMPKWGGVERKERDLFKERKKRTEKRRNPSNKEKRKIRSNAKKNLEGGG